VNYPELEASLSNSSSASTQFFTQSTILQQTSWYSPCHQMSLRSWHATDLWLTTKPIEKAMP